MAKKYQSSGKSAMEVSMERFANLLIARMEEMEKSDWKKGWIDGCPSGEPQNIGGRKLNGSNQFFLQLHTAMKGFTMPVYLTFLQCKDYGLTIKKGAESVPVVFWTVSVRDEKGKNVSLTDYDAMSPAEQELCKKIPVLRYYPEFNVDDTNLQEVNPELYDKLKSQYSAVELRDADGMYCNAAIDRLLERQEWVCPIRYDETSSSAYYSPSKDIITVPKKEQFNISDTPEGVYQDGMEWYSTLIHEMAHSTGSESRLNRVGRRFGDPKYGKEELVAEMSAAVVGSTLGFSSRIVENNTQYIRGWISNLRQEPKFLLSVVTDVGNASGMLLEKINQQRVALGEQAIEEVADTLQQDDSREMFLKATEQKALDILVRRTSDADARAFTFAQVAALNAYLDAVRCQSPTPVDAKTVFAGLFDKVSARLEQCPDGWINDVRDELMELSRGEVRSQSASLRI